MTDLVDNFVDCRISLFKILGEDLMDVNQLALSALCYIITYLLLRIQSSGSVAPPLPQWCPRGLVRN